MILFIAGREAAEAGLQFFRSTNGVYLTAQVISPSISEGREIQPQAQSMTTKEECALEALERSYSL